MGAHHDEDTGCSSSKYIMSRLSKEISQFSVCSEHEIKKTLDNPTFTHCFKKAPIPKHLDIKDKIPGRFDIELTSICGDFQVHGDEECDCGIYYHECSDPCCYSAQISSRDIAWNASAIPCRRHQSPICKLPFRYVIVSPTNYPSFSERRFICLNAERKHKLALIITLKNKPFSNSEV